MNTNTDITSRIHRIIHEQLRITPEAITSEKSLIDDMGADSLDQLELVMSIEDEFGIEIPDDDAEQIKTVQNAVDYVAGRVAKKYIVLNENTLGYVNSEQPGVMGVLAGKPQLGGHDWKNGTVNIGAADKTRAATIQDFEFFRVDPVGHIT